MEISKELRNKLLYEICYSKEELQEHIRAFLKIDLPNTTIDENSNSNAMEFIWQVYKTMLTGQGKTRFTVAASRNTAKTVCACIIRFYGMIHFRRDGTHLAANLQQSESANKYLNKFLDLPEITPFIVTNNTRTKELKGLPPNSYTKRDTAILRIAVSTLAGVNSQRGSLNTKDELDLLPREILAESSFIADPTQDEHRFDPIEINLSSRKTASGPIQEQIDEAESGESKNLSLHKWSLVDWMAKCPDDVCRPDLPRKKAWLNQENLAVTWDEKLISTMSATEKSMQKEILAYDGCQNCPAFVVCQGRSKKQTGTSQMLRSISFVAGVIDMVKLPDKIIAQALNEKPETSSIVYRMFSKPRNFLHPILAYKFITGYYWKNKNNQEVEDILKSDDLYAIAEITPSKNDIYDYLSNNGWHINYGVDWGYSPAQAVVIVTAYHKRYKKAFVFHVAASQNHANQDWAEYIISNIWNKYPGDLICPDMADPASPNYFKKYNIPCRDKKPPRIETGVSQIRSLLWSPVTMSTNFAILDDGEYGQNHLLADAMSKWTHKKTAIGFDFSKFEDDDNCDFCDPTRYALDPFVEDVRISSAFHQDTNENSITPAEVIVNPESQKILEEKQKLKNQVQEEMIRQHGIDMTGFFNKINTTESSKLPSKKNSAIKFKF